MSLAKTPQPNKTALIEDYYICEFPFNKNLGYRDKFKNSNRSERKQTFKFYYQKTYMFSILFFIRLIVVIKIRKAFTEFIQ